ncbi:metallophosphoesterase family protein [Rossellomorea aquimaris]|uniref:hypothetical protein n=1 Tax=Rossellomorea aquimaris TaxID=189382 RepID=UPI0007D0A827|nr:hypothetical protein [Rossellomorea aquimaris]
MKLPTILCGPIVRRVEPTQAIIWIALSKPFRVSGELFKVNHSDSDVYEYEKIDCEIKTKTMRVGKCLYISLVKLSPQAGTFPTNHLLGYNVLFLGKHKNLDLGSFDLLSSSNPNSIVYGDLSYPTFYMNEGNQTNILHGSCRKLHGEGTDVLAEADKTIASTFDHTDRPSALYLTGDQIYADDVSDPIFKVLTKFGNELIGQQEDLSSIEPRLKNSPFQEGIRQINGRQYMSDQFCQFTSRKAANHLFALGEYATMYMLAWSPALWEIAHKEEMFQTFEEAVAKNEIYFAFKEKNSKQHKAEYKQLQARYQKQLKELEKLEESLSSVRRVLANTPTYMMFDDHDITDDWNLTQDWKTNVWNAPLGRHVVSNGLTSYWLFQGWGNAPDTVDHFGTTMQTYFDSFEQGSSSHSQLVNLLWSYDSWHYTTPTYPTAVFLDTRTQRDYPNEPKPIKIGMRIDEEVYSPNLIKEAEWNRVSTKLVECGWKEGEPLILVSPPPLYGIGLIENFLQNYMLPLRTYGLPVQTNFDLEAWKYNGKGFSEFLHRVLSWNPSDCIILSGDVHSAASVKSDITFQDGRTLTLYQFTSSPIKNMSYSGLKGIVMKFIIRLNERKRIQRTLYRYCNENFELVREVREGSIPSDYEWKESIDYQPMNDFSIIETHNNLGLLSYRNTEITNSLLSAKNSSKFD